MPGKVPSPSLYLDAVRRPPTVPPPVVHAVSRIGLDRMQAAFATHCMTLGGVYVIDQVDLWLERHWPAFPVNGSENQRKSFRFRFLQPLYQPLGTLSPPCETCELPRMLVRRQYGHFYSAYVYRVAGLGDCGYRKSNPKTDLLIMRLLTYDYMLRHPQIAWYARASAREALFRSLGVPASVFPGCFLGSRDRSTWQSFIHHVPVGLDAWRVIFVMPCPYGAHGSTTQSLNDHRPLFRYLRALGFRVSVVFCWKGSDRTPRSLITSQGPTDLDYDALTSAVWRYLLALALEQDDRAIIGAQGGREAVVRKHATAVQRIDSLVKVVSDLPFDTEVHVAPAVSEGIGPAVSEGSRV